MAILKIAQMGEPVLRRRAEEVPPAVLGTPEIQSLIDDMIETMHDADGAGIAAPQVYRSVRICVLHISGNPRYPTLPSLPLTVLVNPVVHVVAKDPASLAAEETISMYEGCLSVAGIRGRVRRPRAVRVQGMGRDGAPITLDLEGVLACVIQHELDHLDGVLFVDRADPRTLCFLREYDRFVPAAERIVDWGQQDEDAEPG